MELLACGVSHKTAPLSVRERMVFPPDKIRHALQSLLRHDWVEEAAILSTCNRMEMYCHVHDVPSLIQWLQAQHHIPKNEVSQYLYLHRGQDAVRHIMRVASGLDSLVIGEPQILGQLKDAVKIAREVGSLGKYLDRLFQYVFLTTKEVRRNTAIGASPVSIAYVAVNLAKRIFANLADCQVLLVGAGETIQLVARYLAQHKVQKIFVANRQLDRAQDLAAQYAGQALPLSAIPQYLSRADMIVTATASHEPLIHKTMVEAALKERKRRPMFFVDLAVPRDVADDVKELDDAYVYCVDDLKNVIDDSFSKRRLAAEKAEAIIDLQTEHYLSWVRSLDSVSTIKAFRDYGEHIKEEAVIEALKQIKRGIAPEYVLLQMAQQMTSRFMHRPTVEIRKAGYEGRFEYLAQIRELFDLWD